MDNAEKSLLIFGLYLIILPGIGNMLVPTMLLDLFGLNYGDDTWIRIVGLLAFSVGVYYVVAAKEKLRQLFVWTVRLRFFAAAFMVSMLVLGKVGLPILLFAAADAAGATWTLVSLKK